MSTPNALKFNYEKFAQSVIGTSFHSAFGGNADFGLQAMLLKPALFYRPILTN